MRQETIRNICIPDLSDFQGSAESDVVFDYPGFVSKGFAFPTPGLLFHGADGAGFTEVLPFMQQY
jgi:hypothetical protein